MTMDQFEASILCIIRVFGYTVAIIRTNESYGDFMFGRSLGET